MEKFFELREFILEKKFYVMGVIIFLILLCCSIYFSFNKLSSNNDNQELVIEQDKILEKTDDCIANVDIKGEVAQPGLYKVNCGSRVQDVISLAGGITEKGDTSILNLGKKVNDEMVIIIYSKSEVVDFIETKEEETEKIKQCVIENDIKNNACLDYSINAPIVHEIINEQEIIGDTPVIDEIINEQKIIGDTPVNNLISINKGTKEELMTLSGIGESKANLIINYRNEVGGFKTLEELKNVKGIGNSTFEKIKNNITL